MKEVFFLPRQAHALELEQGYRGGRPAERATATGLTVAIAREVGTPAHQVAEAVGGRLGWPVHDHELLEQVATELGLPVRELEHIDERPRHWMLEFLEGLGTSTRLTENTFVHQLIRLIRTLAAEGHCVLVGRGAAQLLPAPTTLRLRLVGDLEDRITAVSRQLHVDRQEAARRIDALSRDRDRFLHHHFLADPTRAANYDLVLNTSQWSVSECADLILQALHSKEADLMARATQ